MPQTATWKQENKEGEKWRERERGKRPTESDMAIANVK
jgi:hypothetical protein